MVEQFDDFVEALDANGSGEDGEEFVGGVQFGEVEAEFDGPRVLSGLDAGAGEAVEPEEVGGMRGGIEGEFTPVELMLGVLMEEGFDGIDEEARILGESGEGPGDFESIEIGCGLILKEGREQCGGFLVLIGGEVETCQREACLIDLARVVR